MAQVNTHSLKMVGIRKISGETKTLMGCYSNFYLQLFYDRSTGEAWTTSHCSIGHNSWTEYHDADVIDCGNLYSPCTMQEVADIIARKFNERQSYAY